jgi:hypothetical protein
MFDSQSRYAELETASHMTASGRDIRYVRRRLLPSPDAGTTLIEHRISEGERLDNLSAKYLGDPTAFWRVCDANLITYPSELTDELGRAVRIAMPSM